MKLYIAGNDRWAALFFASVLTINHHKIVSTWHNDEFVRTSELSRGTCGLNADRCIREVLTADALVLIATAGMVPGGKFVEVGASIGVNKRVWLVGRRENLLMHHGNVVAVADQTELLGRLHG